MAADDYTPRLAMSSTDMWPACVSDTPGPAGPYTLVPTTGISSIARVEAYEMIVGPSGILAGAERDPDAAAFTQARAIYETDQGLGSRVVRRADEHLPQPPSGNCQMGAVIANHLEYCVGPTQLAPIIREAFAAGMTEMGAARAGSARQHAARIDAALTWFLVLSIYKESVTCTTNRLDCNSMWAKYTGGVNDRGGGIGISRLVRAQDPETHERIWDGLLAVRCWRDLDSADVATDEVTGDRARAQLDRALDRGIALILIQRLRAMQSSSGDEQRAHFAWLSTLLGRLPARSVPSPDPGGAMIDVPARASLADRMIRVRSCEASDFIAAEMDTTDPADVDVDGIVTRLERFFECD